MVFLLLLCKDIIGYILKCGDKPGLFIFCWDICAYSSEYIYGIINSISWRGT